MLDNVTKEKKTIVGFLLFFSDGQGEKEGLLSEGMFEFSLFTQHFYRTFIV